MSAVAVSPSVPTATGRAVGTVTERAVAAGLPLRVPSSVDERLTGVVPLQPFVLMSAAKAGTAIAARAQMARRTEMTFFIVLFFMWIFSFVL